MLSEWGRCLLSSRLHPLPEQERGTVLERLLARAGVVLAQLVEAVRLLSGRIPLHELGDLGEHPVVLAGADERVAVLALDDLTALERRAAARTGLADLHRIQL